MMRRQRIWCIRLRERIRRIHDHGWCAIFQDQPDYETPEELYISTEGCGGKTFSEAFVINVTDVNEANLLKFQITTSTTADATFTDYIKGVSTLPA